MWSKDKSREEEDQGPGISAEGFSPHGNRLTKEGGDRGGDQGFGRTWINAEVWAPEVRRWSIVKAGLRRQKFIGGACGAALLGWEEAVLAKSPSAA